MIDFLKYHKFYFVFSAILLSVFLVSFFIFPLKLGIDLAGGCISEVEYETQRPQLSEINKELEKLKLKNFSLQPVGEKGLILKTEEIDTETHQKILDVLGKPKEKRFEFISSVIGKELKNKAKIMIFLTIFLISLYIIFVFREISKILKAWQYSLSVIFCLLHDILIPFGILSILGKFFNVQITIPIIIAFLTILGYDINNIIVVFDRIRENLIKRKIFNLKENINISLNQTLSRQFNTSLTTIFPLIFIYLFGTETLRYFSLVLIIGILAGLYSSIFLSGSILYVLSKTERLKP